MFKILVQTAEDEERGPGSSNGLPDVEIADLDLDSVLCLFS